MRMFDLNNKGFSITEALIAATIVTSTSFLVTQNYTNTTKLSKTNFDRNSCRSYVNTVMNRISSLGYYQRTQLPRSVNNNLSAELIDPRDNIRVATNEPGVTVERGININHRWVNNNQHRLAQMPAGWTPGTDIIIRTPHLIQGSMAALTSIYNSENYCSVSRAYAGGGANNFFLTTGYSLQNLASTIQIQPYSLNTNSLLACASVPRGNIIVAPPANTASMNVHNVTHAPNVRDDIGFLVTINATYTDNKGQTQRCTKSTRFQYPPDTFVNIGTNNLVDFNNNNPSIANYPLCVTPNNQHDVNLRLNFENFSAVGNNFETGLIAVCQDQSEQVAIPANSASCRSGIGHSYPPPSQPAITYLHGNTGNSARGSRTWVPCHRVTICGRAISSYTRQRVGNTLQLDFSVNNIPDGCIARVEGRLLDSSGNVTASDATNMSVAAYRRCGNTYCGPTWNWTPGQRATWPNGYYRCWGGC